MNPSQKLLKLLREVKRICVLTGAGISAESGIPTFRSEDGIWKKFKPEELASMDAFLKNSELVWEWYQMRRKVVREAEPNAGHLALVELEKSCPSFTLVTQNVDGLHRRAGNSNILELHGNIERSYCIECHFEENDPEEARLKCLKCGGKMRPGVVWFGEALPETTFLEAERAASDCELFFCIGTSAVVFPAAALPEIAQRNGAYLVEVNLEPTELTPLCDESFHGKAGEILPKLLSSDFL